MAADASISASSAGDLIMRQALTSASPETIGAVEAGHLAHVVDDEMARRLLDRERLPGGQVGAGAWR